MKIEKSKKNRKAKKQKQLARDCQRNNELTAHGWSVLRFSGRQIRENMPECVYLIEKTIKTHQGLA